MLVLNAGSPKYSYCMLLYMILDFKLGIVYTVYIPFREYSYSQDSFRQQGPMTGTVFRHYWRPWLWDKPLAAEKVLLSQ